MNFPQTTTRLATLTLSLGMVLVTGRVTLANEDTASADLSLSLPLGRTAYQDNESIWITARRSSLPAVAANDLVLQLTGENGSALAFTFPGRPVESIEDQARRVEHFQVNARFLRPGAYTLAITGDGAVARTNLTVHSHVRRSDFRLVNWGRARGPDQLVQGEDNLGFNLFYGHYADDTDAHFIRAGVDFLACCVMSGGHQMDLRSECDWSDPYVIRGGTRRAVQRAFRDRTRPNIPGIHFYDEPGLTWGEDPQTRQRTPHAVPWQHRSYEAAFDQPPLDWKSVEPAKPDHVARWDHWARWKLSLMDAAWQDAQFGVSAVVPEYLSLTQSQYGYTAFTDGYYFNVVRSLPVTSGHGGYHDWGPGYFNPALFLEFARAGDLAKPNWYLPTWYGNTTADEFRLEQYLCFQCGLQGMISPPDLEPGGTPEKSPAAQGLVESNHLLQRLGPIFRTLPPTRPPVALLFSLSQFLHAQTLDRTVCYAHDTAHGRNVMFTYLAGKRLQHQFLPLLDEEVLDGTLAAHHQAILLTSLDYLDPRVVAALEDFARRGGLVLLTPDSTVTAAGAVRLEAAPAWPDAARIAELQQTGKNAEAVPLTRLRQALVGADRLAAVIRPHLELRGIHPPLTSSEPGLVVTRHATGDMEYLFAVNAAHDPEGNPMLGLKPVTTTLSLPRDGRPVYDVVHSRRETAFAPEPAAGVHRGEFRFGPGQMRVFARTTRPIGGVKATQPRLERDFTRSTAPIRCRFSAAVLDDQAGLLSGPIPLRLVLTDPSGATRYDLFRATDGGGLDLTLPLALNDPPGEWTLTVTELLSGTRDRRTFTLAPVTTCSAAAGASGRAVHWPADRERIFRFFRTHHHVTLVTGTNTWNVPAAERLARLLRPWNITSTTMSATEASQPRCLTEEEARTWCGLEYAATGQIQPGSSNSPVQAGFAVTGPTLLLGTPVDHPLIKHLADRGFLPFPPDPATMPGPGRGYVAWQREAIGVNQESVSLIAYDAAGLSEAVGTVYEMLAGLEPLTPLARPHTSVIQEPRASRPVPALTPTRSVVLPDRITALRVTDAGLEAITHAATLHRLNRDGTLTATEGLDPAHAARLAREWETADAPALASARPTAPPGRLVKLAARQDGRIAVAHWGGWVTIQDKDGGITATYQGLQDVTALVWHGSDLVLGDADGRLSILRPNESP
ncbi:MAG: hypothetical protein HS113_22030 [Verrucomicrobiales bacterium]|nr:hypothetical protein [Verrucomicrobiales bacterium]